MTRSRQGTALASLTRHDSALSDAGYVPLLASANGDDEEQDAIVQFLDLVTRRYKSRYVKKRGCFTISHPCSLAYLLTDLSDVVTIPGVSPGDSASFQEYLIANYIRYLDIDWKTSKIVANINLRVACLENYQCLFLQLWFAGHLNQGFMPTAPVLKGTDPASTIDDCNAVFTLVSHQGNSGRTDMKRSFASFVQENVSCTRAQAKDMCDLFWDQIGDLQHRQLKQHLSPRNASAQDKDPHSKSVHALVPLTSTETSTETSTSTSTSSSASTSSNNVELNFPTFFANWVRLSTACPMPPAWTALLAYMHCSSHYERIPPLPQERSTMTYVCYSLVSKIMVRLVTMHDFANRRHPIPFYIISFLTALLLIFGIWAPFLYSVYFLAFAQPAISHDLFPQGGGSVDLLSYRVFLVPVLMDIALSFAFGIRVAKYVADDHYDGLDAAKWMNLDRSTLPVSSVFLHNTRLGVVQCPSGVVPPLNTAGDLTRFWARKARTKWRVIWTLFFTFLLVLPTEFVLLVNWFPEISPPLKYTWFKSGTCSGFSYPSFCSSMAAEVSHRQPWVTAENIGVYPQCPIAGETLPCCNDQSYCTLSVPAKNDNNDNWLSFDSSSPLGGNSTDPMMKASIICGVTPLQFRTLSQSWDTARVLDCSLCPPQFPLPPQPSELCDVLYAINKLDYQYRTLFVPPGPAPAKSPPDLSQCARDCVANTTCITWTYSAPGCNLVTGDFQALLERKDSDMGFVSLGNTSLYRFHSPIGLQYGLHTPFWCLYDSLVFWILLPFAALPITMNFEMLIVLDRVRNFAQLTQSNPHLYLPLNNKANLIAWLKIRSVIARGLHSMIFTEVVLAFSLLVSLGSAIAVVVALATGDRVLLITATPFFIPASISLVVTTLHIFRVNRFWNQSTQSLIDTQQAVRVAKVLGKTSLILNVNSQPLLPGSGKDAAEGEQDSNNHHDDDNDADRDGTTNRVKADPVRSSRRKAAKTEHKRNTSEEEVVEEAMETALAEVRADPRGEGVSVFGLPVTLKFMQAIAFSVGSVAASAAPSFLRLILKG